VALFLKKKKASEEKKKLKSAKEREKKEHAQLRDSALGWHSAALSDAACRLRPF
jgi:hypothetical protein